MKVERIFIKTCCGQNSIPFLEPGLQIQTRSIRVTVE